MNSIVADIGRKLGSIGPLQMGNILAHMITTEDNLLFLIDR